MPQRNMIGKKYRHHKFGIVKVLTQPNYIKNAPRNVIIEFEDGTRNVVPQRSLRKIKGGGR